MKKVKTSHIIIMSIVSIVVVLIFLGTLSWVNKTNIEIQEQKSILERMNKELNQIVL